ncbi:uncharacterized protein [Watersipora subatra]|uniref:uncharacterized protein n=1 Tax=Watersipora subatra TaxID=2589382 RepID=UPI00355B2FF2
MADDPKPTKPVLSFGISSILAKCTSKNTPSTEHQNVKSAFRSMVKRHTESGRETETATNNEEEDSTVLDEQSVSSGAAGHGETTSCLSKCQHSCGDEQCGEGEDENKHIYMKCMESKCHVLSTTFPIMADIPSHNYIFKSLERFHSKTYSEYRRVGHPYSNRTPPKHKKPRTTFNREQIAELEARFLGQKYLASTERLGLAKRLHLTDSQVKTWFQNRRTKWRRQTTEEREAERNAATKYIIKMQQNAAVANVASAAAAIWPSLMSAHISPLPVPNCCNPRS